MCWWMWSFLLRTNCKALRKVPKRCRSQKSVRLCGAAVSPPSISLSFPSIPSFTPCTTPTSCLAAFPQAWFVVLCLSKHLGEGGEERWEKDEKRRSGDRPQGLERRQQGKRLKNVEQWDRGRLADRHGAARWWGADKWPSNDLRLTGWGVKMKRGTSEDRRRRKRRKKKKKGRGEGGRVKQSEVEWDEWSSAGRGAVKDASRVRRKGMPLATSVGL